MSYNSALDSPLYNKLSKRNIFILTYWKKSKRNSIYFNYWIRMLCIYFYTIAAIKKTNMFLRCYRLKMYFTAAIFLSRNWFLFNCEPLAGVYPRPAWRSPPLAAGISAAWSPAGSASAAHPAGRQKKHFRDGGRKKTCQSPPVNKGSSWLNICFLPSNIPLYPGSAILKHNTKRKITACSSPTFFRSLNPQNAYLLFFISFLHIEMVNRQS